jgi:hypothetical protein
MGIVGFDFDGSLVELPFAWCSSLRFFLFPDDEMLVDEGLLD